nr:hypothetical protein [Nitrosomonas nitrosa]
MKNRFTRRGLFSMGLASLFTGVATNLLAENPKDDPNMRQNQLSRAVNTSGGTTETESGTSIKSDKEEPSSTNIGSLIQQLLTQTNKLIPPGPSLNRPSDELQVWERIKERLATDYAISENGKLSGNLTHRFRSIESDFRFNRKAEDTSYNLLHIEPLIDQAADLFDRGVRDRASWDETGSKWITLMLELHEFSQLDEIHSREETAGVYEIPMKQSWADFLSDKLAALRTSSGLLKLERLLNVYLSHTAREELNGEAQKASWLSGLVAYSFGGERFNGYVSHTFDGKQDTVAGHAKQAAFIQVGAALNKETSYAQVQRDSLEANNAAALTRMDGNKAKYEWDAANSGFLRERTLVARRLQDLKMKMATDPDAVVSQR